MSRKRWLLTLAALLVVGGLAWGALSGESLPLVLVLAGGIVTGLVALGPSGTRADPRDAEEASRPIAQRSPTSGWSV